VTLNWIVGKQFQAQMRQFTVLLDNPENSGGNDTGPMPTELFLTALGGCYSSALAYFAMKMRINIRTLRVTVSGFRSESPPRFTQIIITAMPTVDEISEEKLVRLSELAEKYCTVGNTIKNRTEITVHVQSTLLSTQKEKTP
jgi:putative redox protein